MSIITIKTLEGNGNVIGDGNSITNKLGHSRIDKVLTRDEYFQIILDIRDIERISIATYLEDKFQMYSHNNPDFVKILYKDIKKVVEEVDTEYDNDLEFQNSDFVIEYSGIKLKENPTNLHYALIWLHTKLIEILTNANPGTVDQEIDKFKIDFLNIIYNSPNYAKKLSDLSFELRKERNFENRWNWDEIINCFEFKPNFYGMGINLKYIFNKFLNKKNANKI